MFGDLQCEVLQIRMSASTDGVFGYHGDAFFDRWSKHLLCAIPLTRFDGKFDALCVFIVLPIGLLVFINEEDNCTEGEHVVSAL
uniref:Uncharacterized protein n=1 Tax=Steinernema glaseri TaxID=37863 RepID=A0A1I8AR57_9BILA